VRPRARTLLVALALATLATVLTAPAAHAAEVAGQTHLVAQFNSGHTGWIKIALEKYPTVNAARAHAAIWCQNASGTKVQCGAIEGLYDPRPPPSRGGYLTVEYWDESLGWQVAIERRLYGYWDPDPPLTTNLYTDWSCTGQGLDQYRAVIGNIRIQDAFGQWSGWKTRTHPTWNGSFCNEV
jgi:hypothetical protein